VTPLTKTTRPDGAELSASAEHAWNTFHEANARSVFYYLLRLTLGNWSEAEDHLQETFLRAWRWFQDHPGDLAPLRPWLFTVARRIVIDSGRARQARPTEIIFDDLSDLESTHNNVDRFVEIQAVRDALRGLRPLYRDALFEQFFQERTAKEAADVLGIPEGTVKSRVHYGLQQLRKAILAAEQRCDRPRVSMVA
jgi:RNA polymerase sigma-70 factor (ECF subfamily)